MTRIAVSAEEELASLTTDVDGLVGLCDQLAILLEQEQPDVDAIDLAASSSVSLLAQASETAAFLRMRLSELRNPYFEAPPVGRRRG